MIFPLVLYPPSFEAVYCYICGRRRVAVARYRKICLFLVEVSFHIVKSGLYNDSRSIPCELFAKYMPKERAPYYEDTSFSEGCHLKYIFNFVLSLCNLISTSTFDLRFALLVPPQSENASYAPAQKGLSYGMSFTVMESLVMWSFL